MYVSFDMNNSDLLILGKQSQGIFSSTKQRDNFIYLPKLFVVSVNNDILNFSNYHCMPYSPMKDIQLQIIYMAENETGTN